MVLVIVLSAGDAWSTLTKDPKGSAGFAAKPAAEQARLQLTREPRPLPVMKLNPAVKNIHDFVFEDFTLEGYDPHPVIKAPIAV